MKSTVTNPVFSSLTGLPLEDIVRHLKGEGMLVDWIDFYRMCVQGGWKQDRILERIRIAVSESYGQGSGIEVLKRLKFCLTISG